MQNVKSHRDWEVYQLAFETAMQIFELSKEFPAEEKHSLTEQIRRSSRAVCANLSEAWRKRRHKPTFVTKLNDAEAEAAETQTWIEFAIRCNYIDPEAGKTLCQTYSDILGKLVNLISESSQWVMSPA